MLASLVSVPEATMDEDNCSSPRESDIRRAWQSAIMNAKSIAHSVQSPTNEALRTGVLTPDSAHNIASF